MKTIKNTTLKTLIAGVLSVLIHVGCAKEDQMIAPDKITDKEVLFSINIPGASASGTRALGNVNENEVTSIEMLLFDPSSKKMVHIPVFANVITPDPSAPGNITRKSFSVYIPQGKYDVMIFANSRKAFNSVTLTSGESQEATLAKLRVVMPSGGWATNPSDPAKSYLIPMWGMKKGVTVGQGTAISGVYMHRMVSRIDVKVTGTDTETGNFKLKKINLYNVQKEGRIAPVMVNWNENGMVNGSVAAGLATAPSLVPGCGEYASIGYDAAIAPDSKGCEGGIYIFESSKATASTYLSAPYLTVKGEFEGIEGWYRIDLADYSAMNYYDVLRNHLYKINISKVTGTGFPDEEDAKKNRTDNMVVNVTPWNEYELSDTQFGKEYFVSVSPQDVSYDSQAHTGQMLVIKTDYNNSLSISLSGSASNPNVALSGNWISISFLPKRVENNMNIYTLIYNVDANLGNARTGYIYVTIDRMTVVARIVQEECKMTLSSDNIILSPAHTSRTVQLTSGGAWTLVAQPANATVSPTSGSAGSNINITVTRSNATFGTSTFTIRNTVTNETATVTVDNCYLHQEELSLTNTAGTNTATYKIEVEGGSKTFRVISYSSWITPTKLPNGDLQLEAQQSPDGNARTGNIILAHEDDPYYQVTYTVEQSLNRLPPFDFLVVKLNWTNDLDADMAVEFNGNALAGIANPNPSIAAHWVPFDNRPYYSGATNSDYTRRSVGFRQASYISVDGSRVGSISNGVGNQNAFATGTPEYTNAMLHDGLMFWGGDAQGPKGETVFINAPQITPSDPKNDNSGWSRYLNIEVYTAWYAQGGGSGSKPISVTVSTYEGGMMLKPVSSFVHNNGTTLYSTNFFNVPSGTVSLTQSTPILSPNFNEVYTIQHNKWYSALNEAASYRSIYKHVCTITYDRYRRDAKITWL